MTSDSAQLNELIEVTRDGMRFYEHAQDEVKDAQLKSLFHDMAQAKSEIIQALALKLSASQDQPAQGGTLMGKLRQVYADTKATLASDEDAAYVAELEDTEDRILHAFEDAMNEAAPDIRALLAVELPKIRACHDRMRTLKRSLP